MRPVQLSGRLAPLGLLLILASAPTAVLGPPRVAALLAAAGAVAVLAYLVLAARETTRTLATLTRNAARARRQDGEEARAHRARAAEDAGALRQELERTTGTVADLQRRLDGATDALDTLRRELSALRSEAEARDVRAVEAVRGTREDAEAHEAALRAAASDVTALRERLLADSPFCRGWDALEARRVVGPCLVLLTGQDLTDAVADVADDVPVIAGAAAERCLREGPAHATGGILLSLDDALQQEPSWWRALEDHVAWLRPGVPVIAVSRRPVLVDDLAGRLAAQLRDTVVPQRVDAHTVALVPVSAPRAARETGREG